MPALSMARPSVVHDYLLMNSLVIQLLQRNSLTSRTFPLSVRKVNILVNSESWQFNSRASPDSQFNPDSAIQMSEERTCNSEDTQPCSFKAFLLLAGCFIGQCTDSQHSRLLACSEAECIVFAMEGL